MQQLLFLVESCKVPIPETGLIDNILISYKMQIHRFFKSNHKLSVAFGILSQTPARNQSCARNQRSPSSCCLCESESGGWGEKEQVSPTGDKAALPQAHVNQSRSKDVMSVYRETGQAGPGSSGSRILIIPRRKSGIGLPQCKVRRSELAQQPSSPGRTARLLSGELIILWEWERMSPVQRVQPRQVSTHGILCCGELQAILALPVGACSAAGSGSVSTPGDLSLHVFWGKEEIHITHHCYAVLKKSQQNKTHWLDLGGRGNV